MPNITYTLTELQLLSILTLAHTQGHQADSIHDEDLSNHDIISYLQKICYRDSIGISEEYTVSDEPTQKIKAVSRVR